MTTPTVSFVESNPPFTVFNKLDSVSCNHVATLNGSTGSDIEFNSRSFSTSGAVYSRQAMIVVLVGDNNLSKPIVYSVYGSKDGGGFVQIASKTLTTPTGEEGTDNQTFIINLQDHELDRLGYDTFRVHVSVVGSEFGGSAVMTGIIIAGDIRYGLFGTNAQIADSLPSSVAVKDGAGLSLIRK